MKLRYFVAIFTILMLFSLIFTLTRFSTRNYAQIDILEINRNIQEIKEKINSENEEEIENEYNCQILFMTDEYYSSKLNEAYRDDCIIIDYEKNGEIIGKFIFENQKEAFYDSQNDIKLEIVLIIMCVSIFGYAVLAYIYCKYVLPFKRLEKFASNISKGNLDFPLVIKKSDYFGAFSEAFDEMREALKKAKEGEYEANKSKKELIASLSHDIKTPISTIKAICELLNVKIKDEEILEKIGIIDSKTKIIDSLMNNLFSATLEELEVLKINIKEEPTTIIKELFEEVNYYKKIKFQNEPPEYLVYMDKLRFTQVIDNIINNSYKYANTDIHVSFINIDEGLKIVIKDFGKGCPEEDLALITEKFYRGKNASNESGSGLGLYLAKMFLIQMNGDLVVENNNGFVATVFLKKI